MIHWADHQVQRLFDSGYDCVWILDALDNSGSTTSPLIRIGNSELGIRQLQPCGRCHWQSSVSKSATRGPPNLERARNVWEHLIFTLKIAAVPTLAVSLLVLPVMPLAHLPSGPYTVIPLLWTLGIISMTLIIDTTNLPDPEHTQALLTGFFHAKSVAPPVWYLAINLALLLLGLLGNTASLYAVFTATCTLKRRALELAGVLLFALNVWFNIVHVMPLETLVAGMPRAVSKELDAIRWQLFHTHLMGALIVISVWVHMHAVWLSQLPPVAPQTVAELKSDASGANKKTK